MLTFLALSNEQLARFETLKSDREVAMHGPLETGQEVPAHTHSQAALYVVTGIGLARFTSGSVEKLVGGYGGIDNAVLVPAHEPHAWKALLSNTRIEHVFGDAAIQVVLGAGVPRAAIRRNEALSHQDLPGVLIFPVSGTTKRGERQEVLVRVDPGVTIPLHMHETDAEMIIVAGEGIVHSEDPTANGQRVGPGSCVFFARMKPHGFEAGPDGLSFLSRNGGIVDEQGDWDFRFAA